ncbi:MAG: hypothetical protein PHN74_01120 [Candidatus Pacebacteria bacterium]|nr:hypothetical protein [Candidatus Paceibacterota bacterium]
MKKVLILENTPELTRQYERRVKLLGAGQKMKLLFAWSVAEAEKQYKENFNDLGAIAFCGYLNIEEREKRDGVKNIKHIIEIKDMLAHLAEKFREEDPKFLGPIIVTSCDPEAQDMLMKAGGNYCVSKNCLIDFLATLPDLS